MRCKVFLDHEGPTTQRTQQVIEEKSMTGFTFLHSGESVRPQVLQIYCSPPTDFLSWGTTCHGNTRLRSGG